MASDRLRSVLRIRKLKESQALAEVATVQQRIEEARTRVQERKAAEHIDPVVEEQKALRLRAMQISGLRAIELTDEARAEVHRSVVELEEALRSWSAASARTKSVERLDERRKVEAAVAAMRSSQRSLDELVLMLRHHDSETGPQR